MTAAQSSDPQYSNLKVIGFEIIEPSDSVFAFDPKKLAAVGIDFHEGVKNTVSKLVHRYGSIAPKMRVVSANTPLRAGEMLFVNESDRFVPWSRRWKGKFIRVYAFGTQRFYRDFRVDGSYTEESVNEAFCLYLLLNDIKN